MGKKIFAVLALALLVGVPTFTAFAAEDIATADVASVITTGKQTVKDFIVMIIDELLPWVIGLVALVAVVYFFWRLFRRNKVV